jgi:EmrB/QacA subfamily drug resistance transporter
MSSVVGLTGIEPVLGPPPGIAAYRLLNFLEPARPGRIRSSSRASTLVVATVCIGAFMGQLDASIVSVALPRLSTGLHTSLAAVEWVSLAYVLTLVALVAPVGAWADAVGRKSLYVGGFALFTAASAACAIAPDLALLCVFRVLQAVGAAFMQANSVALIASVSAPGRLGRTVGVQAAAQAVGLAAGPVVGGALIALGSWRLLFLVNVPAGLIGLVTGVLLLPRSRDLTPVRPLDRSGLALFVPAIGVTLLTLSMAAGHSSSRRLAIPLAVVAVVLIAGFVSQQRRTKRPPLLDPALIGRPDFRLGLLASVAGYAALFGTLVVVPLALVGSHLVGTGRLGLELAALPIAIGITAPIAGRRADRYPRAVAGAGLAVGAVALAGIAAARPTGLVLVVLLAALGLGLGAFTPSNNRALMMAAIGGPIGAASGLLNMARGLGTAVGTAVVTVAFTAVGGTPGDPGTALGGLTVATLALCGCCLAGLVAVARTSGRQAPLA